MKSVCLDVVYLSTILVCIGLVGVANLPTDVAIGIQLVLTGIMAFPLLINKTPS